MDFLKTVLIEKAFELVVDFLQDQESIDKGREWVKDQVIEIVNNSDTPWDNAAGIAFLKFLGFSDEELKDI